MKKDHLISAALILAGGILSALCVQPMKSDGQFQDKGNPFAIQRSAYGKLFARLSETTIDRVWHLGVEQIVPHYMSGMMNMMSTVNIVSKANVPNTANQEVLLTSQNYRQ